MAPPEHSPASISLFYSYSHKDEKHREKLEAHLSLLKRQGFIAGWHDRRIEAGTEWDGAISKNLEEAGIILLLVSADFLASQYCWNVEVARAMARHEARTARVIPVILRSVDWHTAPFGKLQPLPKDGKPVIDWRSQDKAFTDVARGIRNAIKELILDPDGGPPDLEAYRKWLRLKTQDIDIRGIQISPGKEAKPLALEKIFIVPCILGEAGRLSKLPEAVDETQLIVLTGEAGAGKSTSLRFLAKRYLDDQDGPLPLLLESVPTLYHHIKSCTDSGMLQSGWRQFLDYWVKQSRQYEWGFEETWLEEQFESGRVIVLIDGLDELPNDEACVAVVKLIDDTVGQWQRCHWVVTSRAVAYQGRAQPKRFKPLKLAELDDEQVGSFVEKWAKLLYAEQNPDAAEPPSSVLDNHPTWRSAKDLLRVIHERSDLRLLSRNPLMLTAMAVIHWNTRRLPESRADLFSAIIDWLLWARHDLPGRPGLFRLMRYYETLALATFLHPKGSRTEFNRRWAAEKIAGEFGSRRGPESPEWEEQVEEAKQFLRSEVLHAGILCTCGEGNDLKFRYASYREYLAARKLIGMPETRWRAILKDHLGETGSGWPELLHMFAGCLKGAELTDSFVDMILESCTSGGPEEEARTFAILGEYLVDLLAYEYRPNSLRYQTFQNKMIRLLESGERQRQLPISLRYGVAVTVGRAGDPRVEKTAGNLVGISPGSLRIGAQSVNPQSHNYDRAAQPSESPVHKVQTGRFEIGKFPVTVNEFAEFIRAGGYKGILRDCWDANGWAWRERHNIVSPMLWDRQIRFPNYPVTGVSWFEAKAYCNWRSAKDDDFVYRLPTEAEWEYAARRGQEDYQPYCCRGATPETLADRVNCEGSLGRKAPVGIFPDDVSFDGVYDLNGNVHEWSEDCGGVEYACAPAFAGHVRIDNCSSRSLRGGCYSSLAAHCRTAARLHVQASNRYWETGFRVVRKRRGIKIKGKLPSRAYNFTLADVHSGRIHQVYERVDVDRELKPYQQLCPGVDAAFLARFTPESTGGERNFPRLPCIMGAVPGKPDFNLLYQDTRLKLAVEEKLGDGATDDDCAKEAQGLMEVLSILLQAGSDTGKALWEDLTDNDLDGLACAVLSSYDPGRDRGLLEAGYKTNRLALNALPPRDVLDKMPFDVLISYQVFAGTVWWDQCEPTLEAQFKKRQAFGIDDSSTFLNEVLSGKRRLLLFFDDNGELVWELVLIQRLLALNPGLTVTGVVSSRVVANNANVHTLERCLEDERFADLVGGSEGRFHYITEDNYRSSIDLAFCSQSLLDELRSADVALIKGVNSFETVQCLPKIAYYAFVVHGRDAQICTGLPANSGVFVRVPARTQAYRYRDSEATLKKFYDSNWNTAGN